MCVWLGKLEIDWVRVHNKKVWSIVVLCEVQWYLPAILHRDTDCLVKVMIHIELSALNVIQVGVRAAVFIQVW